MNPENKKYILENVGKKPVKEIALDLNLKERVVKNFLERENREQKKETHETAPNALGIASRSEADAGNIKSSFITALVLSVIFISAFTLRMIPAMGNKVDFTYDTSFNYRMTEEIIRNGDVPRIDLLSTYPEGKEIRKFYPIGLYQVCAFFYKMMNSLRTVSLYHSILIFCAFFGSVIIFPIYFISYELYKNRWIAVLSAVLAGIIPSFFSRSVCYYYRFEILAVPMLFTSLLFFIKAHVSSRFIKNIFYSSLSAVFMLIGLYVWRLSILFLYVYPVCFIFLAIRNKLSRRLCLIFGITFITPFLFTRFMPGFGTKYTGGFAKAGVELVMQRIAALKYSGIFSTVDSVVVMAKTGAITRMSDFARLYCNNVELEGVSPAGFFGPHYLSFSAVFLAGYIFNYFRNKAKRADKDILFIFVLVFTLLTSVFSRNKTVLGLLTALTFGESFYPILKDKIKARRTMILGAVLIIFLKTGFDSYKIATNQANIKQDSYLTEVMDLINQKTPKNAVILSYWGDGWPIQTYCQRATNTDGLFESPEIVKRIIDISKIYYDNSEDKLLRFCKKYEITHILVPLNRKLDFSTYAGVPYYNYFEDGKPTELGSSTILSRLIFTPGDLKSLAPIYRNKNYILYLLAK